MKRLPIEYRCLEARCKKLETRIRQNEGNYEFQLQLMRRLRPLRMKMVRIYDATP